MSFKFLSLAAMSLLAVAPSAYAKTDMQGFRIGMTKGEWQLNVANITQDRLTRGVRCQVIEITKPMISYADEQGRMYNLICGDALRDGFGFEFTSPGSDGQLLRISYQFSSSESVADVRTQILQQFGRNNGDRRIPLPNRQTGKVDSFVVEEGWLLEANVALQIDVTGRGEDAGRSRAYTISLRNLSAERAIVVSRNAKIRDDARSSSPMPKF